MDFYQEPFIATHSRFFITKIWNKPSFRYIFFTSIIAIILLLCTFRPPKEFPAQKVIQIGQGISLAQVSNLLKEEHVIRSTLLFEISVILLGGETRLQAGDYYFTKPLSLPVIASRFTHGEFGLSPMKITILEGYGVADIARVLKEKLLDFDETTFIAHARNWEGFLFPDTYFFLPHIPPDDVIKIMNDNFKRKIQPLDEKIRKFGKSEHDIVTMASIIEREAMTFEDRRMVSGILWKRIAIGMPLQVDATFLYVNGETTAHLSTQDLAIDSPYNTYRYKGLPKGPIGNPGLDAILAALEPKKSPYLYYLSDKNGTMHYSKTFEEHKSNKEKYL